MHIILCIGYIQCYYNIILWDYTCLPGWKGPCRLMVAGRNFALFSSFGGCVWLPLNHARAAWWQKVWLSVKNGAMAFQRYTKFVADLDLGQCSLVSEGSNVCRVEATPWFFKFSIELEMNSLGQYRAVSHGNLWVITTHSPPDICIHSRSFSPGYILSRVYNTLDIIIIRNYLTLRYQHKRPYH